MLYVFSNPIEDLALTHFVYWVRCLPGVFAKTVLELTLQCEVWLHDLSGSQFQLYYYGRRKFKVVPHAAVHKGVLLEYNETLHHVVGQGLFEAVGHNYW